MQVATVDEVQPLLDRAHANRTVAATDMNEQSSRSHSVFCLRLSGSKLLGNGTAQCVSGELYLVDLAGSERVDKSGVSGDRLREAQVRRQRFGLVRALTPRGASTHPEGSGWTNALSAIEKLQLAS